mmetsp:Transcript_1426/g.2027  ORF Transcript_1426/g.2027 Transcript_1426/m.2027 type:complete len:227 (+) Transcript_1426:174-854(+)
MDAVTCIDGLASGQGILPGCIALFLSKFLGYGVVFGSSALKIPQISTVYRNKSVTGLSRQSIEAETIGYFIALAYSTVLGMPFNAYGENVFLLIQDFVLLIMITKYGDKSYLRLVLIIMAVGVMWGIFFVDFLSDSSLDMVHSGMNLIFYYARLQQIWASFSASSTGQLSLVSSILLLAGTAVRVLTTVQEGGTYNMIVKIAISFSLNFVILAQILYYWPKKEKIV